MRRYVGRPAPGTPCGYCFTRWATGYDHLLPLAAGGTNAPTNLFPCCGRCNGWLSDLVFPTLEAKRAYIAARLAGRPYTPPEAGTAESAPPALPAPPPARRRRRPTRRPMRIVVIRRAEPALSGRMFCPNCGWDLSLPASEAKPGRCRICGKPLEGRQEAYCSGRCRTRACRARKAEAR